MDPSIIGAIIGAVVTAILTSVITWSIAKSDFGQKNSLLEEQLRTCKKERLDLENSKKKRDEEVKKLAEFKEKYLGVSKKLSQSSVVRTYFQPVILVGPRSVGKTSLLMQWHTPWDHSRLNPTQTFMSSEVPIYDFKRENIEPHFADSSIKTDVHIHLKLKVLDFPGEIGAQKSVIEQAKFQTKLLREGTQKALGTVMICMFDASEAATGLSKSSIDYYNGELFSRLRELVAFHEVAIDRLILVFNKYDLLKEKHPSKSDRELLGDCIKTFAPLFNLLRGAINPERVCEVFTILVREEEMAMKNRGAPIVLGEAARNFVTVMEGEDVANRIAPSAASTLARENFL